jgi:hypothetical protein
MKEADFELYALQVKGKGSNVKGREEMKEE